jgi:hypothetical protein
VVSTARSAIDRVESDQNAADHGRVFRVPDAPEADRHGSGGWCASGGGHTAVERKSRAAVSR